MFQDERGAPQYPVGCERCGIRVLVKKDNLAHTVLQWTSSTDECAELAGTTTPRALTPTCSFLRDSVEAGVRARRITVPDAGGEMPPEQR